MPQARQDVEFAADRGRVFGLALKTGILTVLTLGIYRFWMKTRLRRVYWSGIRPGGVPLEYLGQPIEKLLGFLIAVVILAFYLGIVNLILVYASFSLFSGNSVAYALSGFGAVPIWFYARYRAHRYVLARTRWRGIRFELEPAAWQYAWRGLFYWGLTIVSLGTLWPLKTFALEKFKTDRTWFGTAKLHQGGRWTMLFVPFIPVWAISIAIVAIGGVAIAEGFEYFIFFDSDLWELVPLVIGLCLLWPFAAVAYTTVAWRRLLRTKTVGGVGFEAKPNMARVAVIYALGYFLVILVVSLASGILGAGLAGATFGTLDFEEAVATGEVTTPFFVTALSVILYFTIFVLWAALRHAFVLIPLWTHLATRTTLTGATALALIRQRDVTANADAEGFAEALDLGAAI